MNSSDIVQVLLVGQQLLASQQQRVAATQLFEQVRIGRAGPELHCPALGRPAAATATAATATAATAATATAAAEGVPPAARSLALALLTGKVARGPLLPFGGATLAATVLHALA